MTRPRISPFWTTAAVAFVVKLWLTSNVAIVPLNAPHDASNFVEHARWLANGRWFGPYDALTLIKGPTFPIFLAMAQEFGIPLPLASTALYLFACAATSLAIRPLLAGQRALAAGFVLLFFNPRTFDDMAFVAYRSQIGGSLALLVLSCAIGVLLRRNEPPRRSLGWVLGLGIAFSAFWLNREEGIWLVPALAIVLALPAFAAFRELRRNERLRALVLLVPIALWALSIATISAINQAVYGWATVVEIQTPEFVSAYASLARISHAPSDRRFPVPHEALDIAYSISPAARELRSAFEQQSDNWEAVSCNQFAACGDIAGGWFLWALRGAVQSAGHYTSGREARMFYERLSREIDDACNAKAIACEKKHASLAPKLVFSDMPLLEHNLSVGLLAFAALQRFNAAPWVAPEPAPALASDYRFVTRSTLDEHNDFEGWLVAPGASRFEVMSGSQPDASAEIAFGPSPDVAAALERTRGIRGDAGNARFSIRTNCRENCALQVTFADHTAVTIPLTAQTYNVDSSRVLYHLDSVFRNVDFAEGIKQSILNGIAGFYAWIVPWLALAALLALFSELGDRIARKSSIIGNHTIVAGSIVGGCLTVLAILTVIQTFSFEGFTQEYFASPYPLLLLLPVVEFGGRAKRTNASC